MKQKKLINMNIKTTYSTYTHVFQDTMQYKPNPFHKRVRNILLKMIENGSPSRKFEEFIGFKGPCTRFKEEHM